MASLRLHHLLIAGSLILPAGLFLLAALSSRSDALRQGQDTVTRTVAVLNEHARKVFETEELVIERVDARIHDLTWDEIGAQQIDRFLSRLKTPLDQAFAIWISDADGIVRAGSFPRPPGMSIEDRDIYRVLRDHDAGIYVSSAFMGQATKKPTFAVGRRRRTADGHFDGIIHIAASPEYFARFFASAASDIPHIAALIRDDGEILVREPADPAKPRLADDASPRLAPESPLMRAIASRPEGGFYSGFSTLDGAQRIYAYRRVGDYPLYVGFGVAYPDMLRHWHDSLMIFGLAAGASALTLTLVAWLALRAAKAEWRLTARLREAVDDVERETGLREAAEQRVRHALKMEAVGQLTGGIAHDFNNLLMAMLGSLEVLRQRLPPGDERALRLLDNALRGVERGTALTQRLLAFGRRQTLRPGPVDLTALVGGMSDLLRGAVGMGVDIETGFPPTLPNVLVDANQLELALLNLAANARDAMAGRGLLIITARDEPTAPDGLDLPAGAYGVLSVTDSGVGMDEATVARAVEPFFTTKGVGAGTGLGLSMVHGLAAQSGGRLVLRSTRGVGTTAELWLPCVAAVAALALPDAAGSRDRPTRQNPVRLGTVLLVDDDPLVLESAAALLRELGHATIEAESGRRALDILEGGVHVDLVMTDLSMPGMSGIGLADEVHRLYPAVNLLLATAYAHRAEVIECGLPLLAKPFNSRALANAIDGALTARTGASGSAMPLRAA